MLIIVALLKSSSIKAYKLFDEYYRNKYNGFVPLVTGFLKGIIGKITLVRDEHDVQCENVNGIRGIF